MNSKAVAVLGGGIVGLLCAYELSHAGAQVSMFDPAGFVAENASYVAGGMLAPYAEVEHMGGLWIDAGLEGISFWKDFAESSKSNLDFAQNGSLILAHAQDRYMLERFKSHILRVVGGDVISDDILEDEAELFSGFKNYFVIKGEGHIHPRLTMAEIYEQLKARDVCFLNEACDPLVVSDAYDYVIDCRGMGARVDDETLRAVKGELVIVRNNEFKLRRPLRLMHPRYPFYIVPRKDNVFMIGATQIESEGDGVSLKSAMELLSALYSLHPSFGDSQVLEIRSGLRPSYPDNLPMIKRSGNIISANGSFRHGYLMSPVMAQAVSALVFGQENDYIKLLMREV